MGVIDVRSEILAIAVAEVGEGSEQVDAGIASVAVKAVL